MTGEKTLNPILARKVFPSYFQNFRLPVQAVEQELEVYRACPTRRIEKASFLNSYEENGFQIPPDLANDNPQVYCLSLSSTLKGIKRFTAITAKYQPPFLLAKGHTTKEDGVSCKSNEWKTYRNERERLRDSHVDWWLYDGAEPWLAFEETVYESEYDNFPERR